MQNEIVFVEDTASSVLYTRRYSSSEAHNQRVHFHGGALACISIPRKSHRFQYQAGPDWQSSSLAPSPCVLCRTSKHRLSAWGKPWCDERPLQLDARSAVTCPSKSSTTVSTALCLLVAWGAGASFLCQNNFKQFWFTFLIKKYKHLLHPFQIINYFNVSKYIIITMYVGVGPPEQTRDEIEREGEQFKQA